MEDEEGSEQAREANRALRALLAQHELREIHAAARRVIRQVEEGLEPPRRTNGRG